MTDERLSCVVLETDTDATLSDGAFQTAIKPLTQLQQHSFINGFISRGNSHSFVLLYLLTASIMHQSDLHTCARMHTHTHQESMSLLRSLSLSNTKSSNVISIIYLTLASSYLSHICVFTHKTKVSNVKCYILFCI